MVHPVLLAEAEPVLMLKKRTTHMLIAPRSGTELHRRLCSTVVEFVNHRPEARLPC